LPPPVASDEIPAIPSMPAMPQTQIPSWQQPQTMEPAVPVPAPQPEPQYVPAPQYIPAPQPYALWNPALFGAAIVQGPRGVVLRRVALNGPAHRAGLWPGDVLAQVNGRNIATADQARSIIANSPPGAPLMVSVYRFGVLRLASVNVYQAGR